MTQISNCAWDEYFHGNIVAKQEEFYVSVRPLGEIHVSTLSINVMGEECSDFLFDPETFSKRYIVYHDYSRQKSTSPRCNCMKFGLLKMKLKVRN